jgi:hypothetical protein
LTPASAVTFSLFKEHKRTHENDTTKDGKNDTNTKLKLKQKNLKLTMAQDGGAKRVWVSPNAMACRSGTLWA